jgi:hypothetical protein
MVMISVLGIKTPMSNGVIFPLIGFITPIIDISK